MIGVSLLVAMAAASVSEVTGCAVNWFSLPVAGGQGAGTLSGSRGE